MVTPRITITPEELKKKRKPQTLSYEEARLQGYDIQPDWSLKLDYGDNGDLPRQIFVSPDKWEFSDFVYGEQGELQDYRVSSPEGITYSKVELEEFEAEPIISEAEVSVTEALRTVYPELFPTGLIEPGTFKPPEQIFSEFVTQVQAQPQETLQDLVSRGRTPQVESLINALYEVQPGDIDRLFEQMPTPVAELFIEALPLLVRDTNRDAMMTYFFEDPDALRRNLIGVGRNTETVALVKTLYPEITEKGLGEYFNPRVPGTVEGVDPTAIGALPTKTWLDKVGEVIDNPLQLIPFVAGGAEIVELGQLMLTAKKLEDGKEVSKEELLTLKAYVDRATMDTTWGFEVADVIAQLVPFAGEFIATGGIFSTGKTAAVKAGEQALKRIATRTGLRILEGRLAKFGLEVTGVLAGGTLRTIPAGATRIPAATLEKQLQATLTGDEEQVWESAVKALGEQWVEVVSESTGGLFRPLVAPIKGQLVKMGIFRAFIKANPAAKASDLRRLIEKMGYHGVLGEMLEERVADVGHGILEPLGLSDQKFSIPSVRQLTVELAAFSVPGAAAMAIQSMPDILNKLTPKVKEALAEAAKFAREAPEAGFVRIPGEKPEEIEHRGTEPEGIKIGDELSVRFEGIQEGVADIPSTLMFTDVQQTGSTFTANTLEEATTKLAEMRAKFAEAEPVTSEEIARQEPGTPEAGIQETMLPEEVTAKEVRPKGKGKVVQISMEDQLKLQQARQQAEAEAKVEAHIEPEPVPDGMQEAHEAQQEIEGIKATLQTDPIANKRVSIGKDKKGREQTRGLDFFISLKEQNFPEYFTLKQAKMLMPGHEFPEYTQPGTPQFNKVPRDVALDDMTKEFGMTPDEIADRVMAIRQERRRAKAFEAEVRQKATETPLPITTELATAEVTENWNTIGQPKLTLKQALSLSGFFGDYILAEDTFTAFELQRELWSRTRSERSQDYKARMDDLIVSQGLGVEEAFKQASQETLAGELPRVRTDFLEGMSNEMRGALFTVVYHNKELQNYPLELASTITALTNALDGKPIPRVRGKGSVLFPEGGSAWDRLNFVFGKKPKVLKAIEKMTKERQSLKDVVEGVFHETGREPIPIDQETADYLRKLNDIPQGYKTLLEPPFDNPQVTDLRNPADLQFAKAELEIATQLAKGEITFDEFQMKRLEARDEAYPLPPVTKYDTPIDKAFKIPPMFNFLERSLFNRVLKELLMSPLDIGNFLRANKASFDNSYLRQSKVLASGHPVVGWQGHATAWQSMFSQKHTEAEWELIIRDSDFQIYEEDRIKTGHDPLRVPAFAATKGTAQYRTSEEFGFTRQDVERAIPRFTAWLPHVKYSERAFSAGTNKMVWGVWKNHLAWARRYSEKIASGEVVLKEGESFDINQEMSDIQGMLGDLIQRANLRQFSGLAPAMNAFFFAARSKVGRFLLPKHLLGITIRDKKVGFNPRVMKEAWKDFVLWNGYIGAILFLGDWLDLWDTETDPRNAEFMSARIGKTRIDPWAGYRQFVVLYARLITKTGVSSVTGAEYDVNPVGALQSFVTNSLAPLASILLEFWTGRNFLGQLVEYDDAKYWIEKITPFAINDVWEAFEGEGWKGATIATIPAIYGEGVQTYTGDWEDNWNKLGLRKYAESEEPYYDTEDWWRDTASQFKGVDPDTLTPAKGFPPQVKAIAEARLINEHLETMPHERLVSLNADPNLDEPTFIEYRDMWLEREKLVDAGDDAEFTVSELQPDGKYKDVTYKGDDALIAFDKKFKKAENGNFSQRQFSLLVQYHSITDEKKQAEFLEKHRDEIGVNPRDKWLRSHPKENAELAIWGQAKVLTKEAYDHFKTLAKKYDIPDNAIPELLLPPDTSIDTHFEYEGYVSEGTHSGNEAKLLILKDHMDAQEAGIKSYVDWRNESDQPLKLPEESLEYYQLKVDNTQNYADLEEAQEADDEEEVNAIRARKVDGETFLDIERRVNAIGVGTRAAPITDELVNSYVSHMMIGDETSPNSAESKLNRYDDSALNDFLMNEDYWGKQKAQPLDKDKFYLDNYLVPRWRIDVAYRKEDEEYNALQTTQDRQQYLLDNEVYRMDRRRREALSLTNVKTGDRFPLDQVEQFVSYWEEDVRGFRQERFLIQNGGQDPENLTGFAWAMHNIGGIDIPLPQDVPAVQYDDIYDQYTDEFEQLEGFADNQSEHYIEVPEIGLTLSQTREKARDAIRFDEDGKYTEFGLAELQRNAYGKFVPETLVNNYVGYYTIIGEGKPDDYEEVNKTEEWYEDDWFLMENPEFYQKVYKGLLGNEKKDFRLVPAREVFAKYLEYLQIDSRQTKLREDFRWDNLDLDDWLYLTGKTTIKITEKRRRAALTPGERVGETIAELERRLREHP